MDSNLFFDIIGKNELKKTDSSPVEDFIRSLHTAAKCRYMASARLKHKGNFSFGTTTVLSLGLIFIPLMQSAGLKLSFPDKVLNTVQIFLAVSILVYSIINSKARYDVRSEKLNTCGDNIKALVRELEAELAKNQDTTGFDYSDYRSRYSNIGIDCENHTQLDHSNAIIDLPKYYNISGLKKIHLIIKSYLKLVLSYCISVTIIVFEFVFIFDMLNITNVISPIVNSLR